MDDSAESTELLSIRRRGTVDYMRTAGRRSNIHGLVEFDVTDAKRRIREIEERTGERLSFTAFLISCLGSAIGEHPRINAYQDWRGRIHVFDDVDVNVLVETTIEGQTVGVPHVIRQANRRSVRSIHEEIRSAQASDDPAGLSFWNKLALRMPGFLRRAVWRLPQWFPQRWKKLAGTVAVTSVGMFGDRGGWGVSPTNYSLQLTVGGIVTKPRFVDGELRKREMLHVTLTFDHDVIDGAPAARFTQSLAERVESSEGLE
jgi:pyruvate/2-oxoglutarate dehydrogenase complex dihydrolipoamide acyltransferase (E2) component